MLNLDGKVALVTGGGGGIGTATSILLAELGAKVVVADLDVATAEAAVKRIRETGGTAVALGVDLSEEDEIDGMIRFAVEQYGQLDILDNNAALNEPTHFALDRDVATMRSDVWDRAFAVNVRAAMLASKLAIPHMLRLGGGSIINITSVVGVVGDPLVSAYSASKAALIGLTRSIATQQLKSGIRCNAVAPGLVATAAARTVSKGSVEHYEPHQMRVGDPIDIARVVAFLASDYAGFVTGQVIHADGGLLAHSPTLPEVMAALEASSTQ